MKPYPFTRSAMDRPASRRARRAVGTLTLLTAILVALSGSVCFPDSCGDCPDSEYRYECVGFIAPVCDTYCFETGTRRLRLDDCCCERNKGSRLSPTATDIEPPSAPSDSTGAPPPEPADIARHDWRPRFTTR